MKPYTFIFIGRSGSGKGTQADLIKAHLIKESGETSVFRLETGKIFREFIEGKNYSSKIAHDIYLAGGLMPEFLSITMWANSFINDLKGGQHMLLDGSPRKIHEAHVLDSAIGFYKREKPHVIFMNLSKDTAMRRLMARKRLDDNVDDINARMQWYETDVVPTVEFYRMHPGYHFHDINAEGTIEDISADIVTRVFGK